MSAFAPMFDVKSNDSLASSPACWMVSTSSVLITLPIFTAAFAIVKGNVIENANILAMPPITDVTMLNAIFAKFHISLRPSRSSDAPPVMRASLAFVISMTM